MLYNIQYGLGTMMTSPWLGEGDDGALGCLLSLLLGGSRETDFCWSAPIGNKYFCLQNVS